MNDSKIGRWSKAEDEYILEHYNNASDCKVIAKQLHRSAISVLVRYKKLLDIQDCQSEVDVVDQDSVCLEQESVVLNSDPAPVRCNNRVVAVTCPVAALNIELNALAKAIVALSSTLEPSRLVEVKISVSTK